MRQYGFKASIYKKGNEAVVAFSGSDDKLDFWNNLQLMAGHTTLQAEEADRYYNKHLVSLIYTYIDIERAFFGWMFSEIN